MKVVVLHPRGPLERLLTASLLAAGHDVRVTGTAGSPLPVGARPTATASADVVVTVVGGLAAGCPAPGSDPLADLDVVTGGGANVVVVALSDARPVEDRLAGGAGSWTLQASTTLHQDLHRALAARCADGVVTVPVERALQPVDAAVVADRVVRLVRAGPAGRVPDVGGPSIALVGDLAATWARRRGGGQRVAPCPPSCRCWDSALLAPSRLTGELGWEEWLDRRSDRELAEDAEEPCGAELVGAPAGVGEQG